MKDIGLKLSAKRNELKLSMSDVAKLTKMPVSHIRAIEAGDIENFEDDITYLRFYVRAYCKVLDIPFDEMKEGFDDSIDEFTRTISLKAIKEREEIEESVQLKSNLEVPKSKNYTEPPVATTKDRSSIRQNANQFSHRSKRPKMDVSLLSLLAIIVIVVVVVVFVLLNNGFGGSNTPTPNNPEITDNGTPSPEKEVEEDEKTEENNKEVEKEDTLSINQVNANTYEVAGMKINEEFTVDITYSDEMQHWIGVSNAVGQYLINDTFNAQKPAQFKAIANASEIYTFTLGAFHKEAISIKVNGQEIILDESLVFNNGQVVSLFITIKGQ